MRKKISLIPFNSGWGAQVRGCADGAKVLKERGLAEFLSNQNIKFEWVEFKYSNLEAGLKSDSEIDCKSALPLVEDYCKILNSQVSKALMEGNFPVTIGGDHSMAVGTWSAVAAHYSIEQKMGLIWIDAHLDSHTHTSSPSNAYHGMPASALLGYGEGRLKNVGGETAKISPHNICFIGIRSYEEEEEALLEKLGVKIFFMDEVREKGMEKVLEEAMEIVNNGTYGFGLTIDLDAFDPDRAPGVGSPELGGILRKETFSALRSIGNHSKILGVEIAEYNPYLGEDLKTTNLVMDLLSNIFVE